jgi:rubrerythrin
MILKLSIIVIRKRLLKKGTIWEMFTLHEIYDLAIQIEKNGEDFFRNAEEKISDPSLKALFLWLAEQEIRHGKWFMQKKETSKTGSGTIAWDEMSSKMLQDIVGDQSFSLKEVEIDHIDTVEDLLSIAIEFEEDTIIFFRMINSILEDAESLGGLDEIIEEEKHHIEALRDYQEKGEQDLTTIKEKS